MALQQLSMKELVIIAWLRRKEMIIKITTKSKKEIKDASKINNADAKVEDSFEESYERNKIEKILESLSKEKIPSYEIIEKLHKIIQNYYETVKKSEIETISGCNTESHIESDDESQTHVCYDDSNYDYEEMCYYFHIENQTKFRHGDSDVNDNNIVMRRQK